MLSNTLNSNLTAQWPAHRPSQRLIAAVLAIIISSQLLFLFRHSSWQPRVFDHQNKGLVETSVFLLKEPLVKIQLPREIGDKKISPVKQKTPANKQKTQNKIQKNIPPAAVTTTTPTETPNLITNTVLTDNVLSADPIKPLIRDSAAIKKAYNDSRTEIQLLEERSGKQRINDYQSKYERYQDAADRAKIEDCIKPKYMKNFNILLAPVIAAQALLGKCK
jgi:hypothetical protein